jgi:hypothetical protein
MTEQISVKIIKSTIPIVWLDTSVITVMTQWKHSLCKLDDIKKERISNLYNFIYDNTQKGKIICPLAEQDQEIWVERDKWLNTILTLSLGIETLVLGSIQNKQRYIFMKAFLENKQEIILNYKDVFHQDPVEQLKNTLDKPFFVTVNKPVLFGEDHQKNLKQNLLHELNQTREKNIKLNISFEKQLGKEYMGELEALFILQKQFLSGQFKNEEDQFNATCGTINLNSQLMIWKNLTGKTLDYKGLIDFYKSLHYRAMPYTNLSCNLFARLMIDKQPIRSGDEMDIRHISTLMPFSNIFITDKAMSTFLRKKKFDKLYNTIICYIGDTQIIDSFFSNL